VATTGWKHFSVECEAEEHGALRDQTNALSVSSRQRVRLKREEANVGFDYNPWQGGTERSVVPHRAGFSL
jgi:hypothetical protein